MLRATWSSLWSRKFRLFLSTFAIVLGVAFAAGSLVFTATLERAFQALVTGSVSDVVVRADATPSLPGQVSRTVPAATIEQVRAVPGVRRVEPIVNSGTTFVLDRQGRTVGGAGTPGYGVNFQNAPAAHGIPGLRILSGRAPQRDGEVAVDPQTLKRAAYRLGQRVPVVTGGRTPRVSATVVGTVQYASAGLVGASLVVWDTASAQRVYYGRTGVFSGLWVVSDGSRPAAQVSAAVGRVLPSGLEAQTGDAVADERSNDIRRALSFITASLLVFAGIAVVVGSFLIVNTFSMLVAQRTQELALLRALGASRAQVVGSVQLEALIVGLVGATLGVGLGFALAAGVKAGFGAFGVDLSAAPLQFSPIAVLVPFALGPTVTALAACIPARRAARVAPVAALRDDDSLPESVAVRRALIGGVMVLLGGLLEAYVLTRGPKQGTALLGVGMLTILLGVVLAAPVLGRPVIGALGAVFGRLFGTVGVLARENALRQPRRTAATASALMIGLALVSMMSVLGASASASVDALVEENIRGDYVLSSAYGRPFAPSVTTGVQQQPGVAAVARVRFTPARVGVNTTVLAGVDVPRISQFLRLEVQQGTLTGFGSTEVAVAQSAATQQRIKVGQSVQVRASARPALRLRVVAIVKDNAALAPFITPMATYAQTGAAARDNFVYLARSASVPAPRVRASLEGSLRKHPEVSLKDLGEFKAEQRSTIDQLLLLIYALLGLAVIIAMLGIVNTLVLSVLERTREIGLLRAVGLSRRQLRRMIRLESVTISVLGAVLGIALGVAFGVILQRSQADSGIAELRIPWARLAVFVLAAAVAGVLAAWWPARRAARLKVLEAINSP